MQKITPSLWFDNNCEEALNFYVSVFGKYGKARIISIKRYPEASSGVEVPGIENMQGKVLTAIFELFGQRFMALDGGPLFKFTEAISFYVECDSQEEVDEYWNALTADGGQESQCGWLKDKFGLSWQISPKRLGELIEDPDPVKSNRVLQAMLGMKKIIIADLEKAYSG